MDGLPSGSCGRYGSLRKIGCLARKILRGLVDFRGGSSLDLMVQSDDPEWARFVENRLWIVDEMFWTLHLVGSGTTTR